MRRTITIVALVALISLRAFAAAQSDVTSVVKYPLIAGGEIDETPVANPPYPANDDLDIIGSNEIIGRTYYKVQAYGSAARRVVKSDDGYIHFCYTRGEDYSSIVRHIWYNFINPGGVQGFPGVGESVEYSVRAGYCSIDVTTFGRAVVAFHQINFPGNDPHVAVAVDLIPHYGGFMTFETPQAQGVELLRPVIQVDDGNIFHIVATGYPDDYLPGDPVMCYYTKGHFSVPHFSITFDPWQEMTSSSTGSVNVAPSDVSNRVAWAWIGDDYNIHYLIDEDGHNPDWNLAENLTNLTAQDTFIVHNDLDLFIDQNDFLHVTFTTIGTDLAYCHASIVWHWSEQNPDQFSVIHNAFDDFWWNFVECGAKAREGQLGQNPNTGYFYCTYRVYDVDTLALSAGGYPSGETYISISTDGGLNWSESRNITETVTPTNAPSGECLSEIYTSLASWVDHECYIIYVLDKDAGSSPLTEANVIYHNVPVGLLSTTPLVPQNVHLHVGGPPVGPCIAVNQMGATIFPVSGGALSYNIVGWNDQPYPVTVDIWLDVTLPNGSNFGPVLGPILNFTMASGWSVIRYRGLNIPATAPEGAYLLNGYLGTYDPINPTISAEDHFYFIKATGGDGDWTNPWFGVSGETFEDFMIANSQSSPTKFGLIQNHPNPFNPVTTISFDLPEACYVKLEIFDITGRNVGTHRDTPLIDGWRQAGYHEATFDASGLPSGIYLARMEAGDFTSVQKMVLMK